MNDIAAFFAACAASPAVLTSVCALIVVPIVAWCIVMLATPLLRGMDADPRWQAALSAVAAAMPGALFVIIGVVTLRDAWAAECLRYPTGRVLYGVIAAITVLGLVRAVILAVRRRSEIGRLLAASQPPGAREHIAGERAGLRVRRVRSDEPFVLLAGVWRPVALVSTEALRRLNDAELEAAIRHEAAHDRHGDQALAVLITFIGDVVPLPVAPLVAMYRRAREFAADHSASRETDPCELASALLSLARSRSAPAGAAAFAEPGTVRARLVTLLTESPESPARWRRVVVTGTLLATFAAGLGPTIVALLAGIHCYEVM